MEFPAVFHWDGYSKQLVGFSVPRGLCRRVIHFDILLYYNNFFTI